MLKIYRPTKTNKKTQDFGENKACVKEVNGKVIRPFQVVPTKNGKCPLNTTPFYPQIGMRGHNGEDWRVWNGEPLYFPVSSPDVEWWSRSEVDSEGGIGIDVFSSKRIHLPKLPDEAGTLAKREWEQNNGWVYIKFRFWHLKEISVSDARRPSPEDPRPKPNVKFGQLIGKCDNTGASSGHHLHWTWKIVANNSMTLDSNNGYYGGLDFSDYFENTFVLDKLIVAPKPPNNAEEISRLLFQLQEAFRSLGELLKKLAKVK